jgi:hypothetical protein
MGPWEGGRECVGACVAWCDMAHVHAASMPVRFYIDMGIPMHALSDPCVSQINEEEETFEIVS